MHDLKLAQIVHVSLMSYHLFKRCLAAHVLKSQQLTHICIPNYADSYTPYIFQITLLYLYALLTFEVYSNFQVL